jgi:GNAT-family acetyltransferase (TIGR03103 family)
MRAQPGALRPTLVDPVPVGYDELNRYTQIIVDEALRRGATVEVLDPRIGEITVSFGDRTVHTIESLSELTSAVAFRRCDHKGHTRDVLTRAGLRVPAGRAATFDDADAAFLDTWGDIVVKPARGEQGRGITVGVVDAAALGTAVEAAQAVCADVLLEQRCPGNDLRVLVIDGAVVAASVRRPPVVTGDGTHTLAELITARSAQREAATDGASTIPLDAVTEGVVQAAGHELEAVPARGDEVLVRRTANLHTGGTIEDVTDALHPEVARAARAAAAAIDIPVVGLDLMVPDLSGPDHVFIEANEQPGLANHEPRPTVERFIDLLLPATRTEQADANQVLGGPSAS